VLDVIVDLIRRGGVPSEVDHTPILAFLISTWHASNSRPIAENPKKKIHDLVHFGGLVRGAHHAQASDVFVFDVIVDLIRRGGVPLALRSGSNTDSSFLDFCPNSRPIAEKPACNPKGQIHDLVHFGGTYHAQTADVFVFDMIMDLVLERTRPSG
jgi:hypothetical protein